MVWDVDRKDAMPLVIIESSDGTGKSTLADALQQRFVANYGKNATARYLHFGPPEDRRPDENLRAYATRCAERFFEALKDYDPENYDDLWVLDRAHIGSPIYGSLFRPETNLDGFGDLGQAEFFAVERFFNKLRGYLVYLAPDPDVVVTRTIMRAEGEDEYLDSVSEARKDGKSGELEDLATEREMQIRKIMGRYAAFFRDVHHLLPTYPGHPFYVPRRHVFEYDGEFKILPSSVLSDRTTYFDEVSPWVKHEDPSTWPDIAFNPDVNQVADYILTRATTVQLAREIYSTGGAI